MKTEQPYLLNAWYVAALSSEVGPVELFHRKLLDISVMIYRKQDGTAIAMHDRCPHRFAPMHLGKRDGDEVSCLYHGLKFDCAGACTHNPHGNGMIPKAAKIRTYPLLEKHGFLWIWMGDAAAADPALLPDFSELDNGPDTGVAHTYMHMAANYELITDNLMDLSHIDYVHGEIITTRGQLSPQIPDVKESAREIRSGWLWEQTPPLLILAPFLPQPEQPARHYLNITWTPPANVQLSVAATQEEGSAFDKAMGQYDLHTTTPETARSTHYFFATRRNHLVDDAEFNQVKIKAMHDAFNDEDGPIIQAVHDEMDGAEFFSLNPVLMTNDVAPVKVRRLLKKLIQSERAVS